MPPPLTRRLLIVPVALGLLVGGALAYGVWRSPESATLDDAARADAPGEFIALARGQTHYDLAGPDSGRFVVLVHGFSVPYYIWDSTAVALRSSGYRVLRYDLYGRGFSDRPRQRYDGSLYVEQLGSLLDSLKVTDRVDLVALSFGGFVASSFVRDHPDRVRTLTLVDPMSGAPEVPSMLRVPFLGSWLWTVSRVPDLPAGQMTDFLHPEKHATWIEQYRPQMRFRGFARALLSTVLETSRVDFDDLFAGVAKTGVPVMLIWGRQDRTIPFDMSEVVLRNIPSTEFVPVDSAGHLPHMEQAAFVNAALTSFLEANPERDRTPRPSEEVSLDLSTVVEEVTAAVWAFHAADTARDAEAVISLLWPEYEMLVDGERMSYAEVAAGSREFMAGLQRFHTVWTDLEVLPLGPDLAISSFLFSDSLVASSGTVTRSRGPTTLLWQRRNGEWRVRFGDADHYPIGEGSGSP